MRARTLLAWLALFACGMACGTSVRAQAYPTRPIQFIVPFSPGGGTDFTARILAPRLTDALGQSVVVQNVTGASGNIAAERVAKAPPDGYTLLLGSSPNAVAMSLFRKVSFDFVRDFAAVVYVGSNAQILIVNPVVPATTVSDLVRIAQRRPGELTYGSAGAGAASHLGGELLGLTAGIRLTHVPYKGASVALIGVMSGEVDMAFGTLSSARPHITTRRLKPIAVASPKRSVIAPEVPTFAEQGVPNFHLSTWYGIQAPRGTPPEVVARLASEVLKILALPEIGERMLGQGIELAPASSEEYARHVEAEVAKWSRVIREAKLQQQ